MRRSPPAPEPGWSGSDRPQRTARLVDDGWVLPWGLGRQADPASAAYVARRPGEGVTNRTGRRWTPIGPAGGPAAAVDPAGLVTPRLGGWSVDWWVGADDRWRLPSREPAVRQGLVDSAPVVETALRVPGGDAVHRCYGVPGSIVVEVENRSPSPFALALVVRPFDPLGAVPVVTVAVDGARVVVDGRTALVLAGRPGRVAVASGAEGDVAGLVLGGQAAAPAAGGEPVSVTCADGLASAAVIVPVAHRATVRAVIPVGDGADGLDLASGSGGLRLASGAGGLRLASGAGGLDRLPSVEAVVRGWKAQGRAGMRAELPDPLLQRAFDAARCSLLLTEPDDAGPAEAVAVVVTALGRLGRHAEADDLVRALWSRQRTDGSFDEPEPSRGRRGAPGGPHLWALGEHLRLRADNDLASVLDRSMMAADGWLRELDGRGRLLPQDRRWGVAGRRVAGAAAGEAGLAVAASALLAGAAAASAGLPPGPPTSTAAAVLSLVAPTRLPPEHVNSSGADVVATLAAAAAELAGGDRAALDRLPFLLGAGGPTWSWPDHVHPRTGAARAGSVLPPEPAGSVLPPEPAGSVLPPEPAGSALPPEPAGSVLAGSGASTLALAGFLLLVRDMVVIEPAAGHAVLVPVLPDAWRRQPIEAHDVALAGGVRLSFAVRWHGARPALLWEASRPVRLTAPGLDPTFTAHGDRGDALLEPVTSTTAGDGGTVELS